MTDEDRQEIERIVKDLNRDLSEKLAMVMVVGAACSILILVGLWMVEIKLASLILKP